jgi:hypothetical protein
MIPAPTAAGKNYGPFDATSDSISRQADAADRA